MNTALVEKIFGVVVVFFVAIALLGVGGILAWSGSPALEKVFVGLHLRVILVIMAVGGGLLAGVSLFFVFLCHKMMLEDGLTRKGVPRVTSW